MPNTTANFALPYPNGTDDPCDFAAQWCDFTAAVNEVLDGFQATIDRTVPTIPAAQMRATTTRTYNAALDTFVTFDTVTFDTAGWTDFDANPRVITTDRAAVFNLSGSHVSDPGTLNSIWTLRFQEIYAGGTVQIGQEQNILDRGPGGTRIGNILHDLIYHNQPAQVLMEVFVSSSSTFTITSAFFTVWWHADTVRPA